MVSEYLDAASMDGRKSTCISEMRCLRKNLWLGVEVSTEILYKLLSEIFFKLFKNYFLLKKKKSFEDQ